MYVCFCAKYGEQKKSLPTLLMDTTLILLLVMMYLKKKNKDTLHVLLEKM